MTNPGEFSLHEITTQGGSWRSAIEAALAQRAALQALMARSRQGPILFIGCGSTHCLAMFAAPYFQEVTGIPCRAAPSSELLLGADALVAREERPLVVALSRSGETSETVRAVQALRQRGCEALAISCYDQVELSRVCTQTICLPGGREQSFAQTRSFAGMLVGVQMLAALTSGDDALLGELRRLPDLADDLIARMQPTAQRIGRDESIRRITYLGSGALYGLACEAMIKMKEMSLSIAEAFHAMEFRHGPLSLVDGEHLTVALVSEARREYELAVLRDIRARGGRVLAIAQRSEGMEGIFEATLALDAPLSERARAVLYMPVVQLLAYHRAIGRGLNPDRPRNVVMAIRLDGTEMV